MDEHPIDPDPRKKDAGAGVDKEEEQAEVLNLEENAETSGKGSGLRAAAILNL